MTNTIKALIITTLITNWVPVKIGNIDREIGVVIEHREAHIGKEVLQMRSRIVNQKLVREPLVLSNSNILILTNPPVWNYLTNRTDPRNFWFIITNEVANP